ncbi:tRNA (guanosine(18)-2'-O)-methyltransferase [Camellia lanceoleosa]|uniref:tRNA (Guanosine(18)-2'-O)-methyltransferase n=1 Tax=Camellia lanceoleosa TaxID=1840588 RepID=A0ACC0J0Z8_9ERIC|nr:tRNA (guanosine(18)-2'-O)-methyltransferase [Camellia lanceoleosa]
MSASKTLARSSFSFLEFNLRINNGPSFSSLSLPHPLSIPSTNSSNFWFSSLSSRNRGFRDLGPYKPPSRCYGCVERAVIDCNDDETVTQNLVVEPPEDSSKDTVEELLSNKDDVSRLMKMERRPEVENGAQFTQPKRWFPYLNTFKAGGTVLSSGQVLEALNPYIMETRKERFRNAVKNRSYSVCLVVEGLNDFGNVSAAFRSADALGFQSVHVVSCDSSKRYRDNRHVSKGAEKWLDIELWNSTQDCFKVLKSRGYCIATTHVGIDAVSIFDMDWSCPTAIVVGNETRGISDEALELSDLRCSIPMNGMVDSFNVSVAAGILMHHAVCDRTTRLGRHGDLTLEESQILLAEFSLRHSKSAISIAHEFAKRKAAQSLPKL